LGIVTSLILIFFLEPSTLFLGAQLFIFGLVAYYIRMVGYDRVYLAMGGMNFGISAFSALLAGLVITNSLPVTLSPDVALLVFCVAVFVSVVWLVAGFLNITRKTEERGG
jgi:hypothetical protein